MKRIVAQKDCDRLMPGSMRAVTQEHGPFPMLTKRCCIVVVVQEMTGLQFPFWCIFNASAARPPFGGAPADPPWADRRLPQSQFECNQSLNSSHSHVSARQHQATVFITESSSDLAAPYIQWPGGLSGISMRVTLRHGRMGTVAIFASTAFSPLS